MVVTFIMVAMVIMVTKVTMDKMVIMDTQCYQSRIWDLAWHLAGYKGELWDFWAKLDLFWVLFKSLVPVETKSQICDLVRSTNWLPKAKNSAMNKSSFFATEFDSPFCILKLTLGRLNCRNKEMNITVVQDDPFCICSIMFIRRRITFLLSPLT